MPVLRISIVEDIPEIREGLKYLLSQEPEFAVIDVYSKAREAYEGLIANPPEIVIMDINLPDGSGLRCMQHVRETAPAIQFLIFTIYEDSDQIFQALSLGVNGYLLKSSPPAKIVEAIRELHQGGAPMSASIAKKVIATFQRPLAGKAEDNLSIREQEVLMLLSKGLLYKEIAVQLSISVGTVRQHIHHIYKKLQVQNRTEALNKLRNSSR